MRQHNFLSRQRQPKSSLLRKSLTSLKTLTILLVMLLSVNVWGAVITFTPDSETSTSSVSVSPISFAFTNGTTNTTWYNDGLRFYEGATITISSESTITKIEFTHGIGNSGCLVLDGEQSGSYAEKTWSGSAKSIKFKVTHSAGTKNGQVKLTQVKVTYEGVAKTLTSVVVSGTPTKTTYEAGEEFDPAGLVVTGTYSEGDPEIITSNITWDVTPSGALTIGTTSVSVTATVDDITSEAYTVNGLTVTAVLPKITITKTSSGITTSYSNGTFTLNDVTFAYTQWTSSTNFIQAKASQLISLQNTTAMPGKITKIQVITGTGKNARAVTIKAGTTSVVEDMVSITSPTTSMDMTFDFGKTNYTYFCLSTPSNACYFDKIIITYEENLSPVITTDPTSVTFPDAELTDAVDDQDIAVEAANLTEDITVSLKHGEIFEVTPASITLTDDAVIDTINVAYLAEAVGEYKDTIVLTSGTLSIEIPVAVKVVESIIHPTSVTIDKQTLSLAFKNTETLTATVLPENANDKSITWKSLDATIASVTEEGAVTALKAGTTQIVVITTDGELTDTCNVTVTGPQLEEINTIANIIACYDAGVVKDSDSVRVKGYISNISLKPTNFKKYGSVIIWMTDTLGGTAREFEFYNGLGMNGDTLGYFGPNFNTTGTKNIDVDTIMGKTNGDIICLGDYIEIAGKMKKFNNTYEVLQGCYITYYNGPVAKIGNTVYETLTEAVAAAKDGETVVLTRNAQGSGIMIESKDAKNITIDFGNHTYTVSSPAVGSTGTQTQGFHFEQGCTITMKNGKVTSTGEEVKMLIQNYCNLTLDGLIVDGTNLPGEGRYVVSNNSGAVEFKGATTITAKEGDFAFDACQFGAYPIPTITIADDQVRINGKIEDTGGTIQISNGTFTQPLEKSWCAQGFDPKQNADGTYGVDVLYTIHQAVGIQNGTITISKETAFEGDTVTLVATPASEDYILTEWIVKNGEDSIPVVLSDTTTFLMPNHDVLVSAVFKGLVFDTIIATDYTAIYQLGETFKFDGQVTAILNNTVQRDVTEVAQFSTPDMNIAGTQEVTVTHTINGITKTTSFIIDIRASYNITWMIEDQEAAAGEQTTNVAAGQKVSQLPATPAACGEGSMFMGWTAEQDYMDATAPIDLFRTAEESPAITNHTTFYAVYAQAKIKAERWGEVKDMESFTDGEYVICTENYSLKAALLKDRFCNDTAIVENGQLVSEPNTSNTWTITKVGGNTYTLLNGKVYAGAKDVKNKAALLEEVNDFATWKISIVEKEFVVENIGRSASTTDPANAFLRQNGVNGWASYSKGTGEAPRFFKHEDADTTILKYATVCAQPILIANPTFSVSDEETLWETTEVALSCETPDVTIFYSTGGEYQEYTEALQLTETTTLSAYATDDNGNLSETVKAIYTFGPVFQSLEDLVAADIASGTTVRVSFENIPISGFYTNTVGTTKGIYLDIQKNDHDVEIYYKSDSVPTTWEIGGTVSGTMTCPWEFFDRDGVWELDPKADSWSWNELTYKNTSIESIAIELPVDGGLKLEYTVGEIFDITGIHVIATYDNGTTLDVTDGAEITFAPAEALTLADTLIHVTATYENLSAEGVDIHIVVNNWTVTSIEQFIANDGERGYLRGVVSENHNGSCVLTDETGSIYLANYVLHATNDNSMKRMPFSDDIDYISDGDSIVIIAEGIDYDDFDGYYTENAIVIYKSEKTDIDQVNTSMKVIKELRQGQVIIICGKNEYHVSGSQL